MSNILLDFKDIVDAVSEELKVQAEDLVTRNRIKRMVNECYMQEVVPYARWKWLEGSYRTKYQQAYYGGYVSVTPNSTTATLSVAPDAALGSFKGKYFSTTNFSEVYTIASHTAGSTTLVLSSEYLGTINTAATFKIWTDKIALPTDCRETVTVWHNMNQRPMEPVGRQKLRELIQTGPKNEGYPKFYYVGDYFDPSVSDGETESDRYRELQVYPAVNNAPVTISIDYIKEVSDLSLDGDEPAMPKENRIVLKYGALKTAWRTIASNESQAMFSAQEFNAYLARMAGKLEDTQDKPQIHSDSLYLSRRRAPRYRAGGSTSGMGAGGGSTSGAPTYLENVTIAGGTLTQNLSVTSGKTIDGVDISVLNDDFEAHLVDTIDAHDASAISYDNSTSGLTADQLQEAIDEIAADSLAVTSVTLTDNTSSQLVLATSYSLYTTFSYNYALSRGSGNIERGIITVVTDGTYAAIAQGAVASLGTLGVDFSVDVSGSDVRLLATTSSTGTNVTMKYSLNKRLV